MGDPVSQIGLGAAALIGSIFLRSKSKTPTEDSKPTTLAEQGASIPLLIGLDRVAPIMVWAGDRKVNDKGGGKSTAAGGSAGSVYRESGMHALCVGTAAILQAVIKDGKRVFELEITRANHQSGDAITIRKQGTLRLYWGEIDQPIDPFFASKIGVQSAWPLIAWVGWQRAKLGTSPNWPTHDYVIGVPPCTQLAGSANWISDGGDAPVWGANPAHAIYQILHAPRPQGIGIPAANLDANAFESAGVLFENEGLPITINAANAALAYQAVGKVLEEVGMALVQVGDRLTIIPTRLEAGLVPSLDDDIMLGTHPPIRRPLWPIVDDRVTYTFRDALRNFRGGPPIRMGADGRVVQFGNAKGIVEELETARSEIVATKMARRVHIQQTSGVISMELEVTRGARYLSPGQVADTEYGRVRVASALKRWDGTAILKVAIDPYSTPGTGFDQDSPPIVVYADDQPDLYTIPVEVPGPLASAPLQMTVARIRGSDAMFGGAVWFSPDRMDFSEAAAQPTPAAGGVLLESVTTESDWANGIRFKPANNDVEDFASAQSESFWLGGERLLILYRAGSSTTPEQIEVAYADRLEKVSDDEWIVRGVLRGVLDHHPLDFAAGDVVAIVQRSDQAIFNHALIAQDQAGWYKSVPDQIDLGQASPYRGTPRGRYGRPLPVDNLEASSATSDVIGRYVYDGDPDGVNQYVSGETCNITWTYRSPGDSRSAGAGEWDTAIASGSPPSDGSFVIRVYDSIGILRGTHTAAADSTSFAYTSALRTTDLFTANPSEFDVEVAQVVGGVESLPQRITVTLE